VKGLESPGMGMPEMKETIMLRLKDVSHHRNGCSGNPFYVVRFRDNRQEFVAVVFEDERSVAVLDLELLSQGVIAFGENSWRGDDYEPFLRRCIAAYDEKLRAATDGDAIHRVTQGGDKVWKGNGITARSV
jgi:hypothetical protein